ncbi:MAG TPA: nucleoside deaminase [Gaiellaceae bacterium]|nr:nucleoside deaminase [Gaiellaceae bacterium]
MDEWRHLEEPWRACFEGAWDAFIAGTIPVGAAVAAADGTIVARGRNRIFDPPGQRLAGSRLAHAEVDALAQLPRSARYRDHVLYSTLEPCLLCVAATLHATVGRIEYAATDPFGGGCLGTIDTAHWRRSAPEIRAPRGGWPGRLSSALQSAFWQRHSDHPRAAEIVDGFGEEARAAGKRLLALESRALAARFQDALPQLLACLG